MAQTSFEERLARLQPAHGPDVQPQAYQPREPRPVITPTGPNPIWEFVMIPLMVVVGFASVLIGRVVIFHYATDDGFMDSLTGVGLMGDIGIDMALSGLVVMLLYMKGYWLGMIGHFAGGYVAMWHEDLFMEQFPWLWAQMYSPTYVISSLTYFAETSSGF